MRTIVYGAGAIGSVVGGYLSRAGSEVVLIGRQGHIEAINKHGLQLITPAGKEAVAVPAVTTPDQVSFAPGDVVFLCVKSQDTDSALNVLKQVVKDVPIFCFQNGVRNEETARQHFSSVYGVRLRLGAVFLTNGEVITRRDPPGWLVIGRYPTGTDDVAENVAASLRQAGFDVLVTPDVMPYKYSKLLRNLNNAIGAITNENEKSSSRTRLVSAVRDEAKEVLAQAGIHWISDDEELRQWSQRSPVRSSIETEAQSSTWQSLVRQTGSVETDYLNGEIVRLARQIGRQAPLNEILLRVAKEMADRRDLPGKYTSDDLLRLMGL